MVSKIFIFLPSRFKTRKTTNHYMYIKVTFYPISSCLIIDVSPFNLKRIFKLIFSSKILFFYQNFHQFIKLYLYCQILTPHSSFITYFSFQEKVCHVWWVKPSFAAKFIRIRCWNVKSSSITNSHIAAGGTINVT